MTRALPLIAALCLSTLTMACTAGPGKNVTTMVAAPVKAILGIDDHWTYEGTKGPEHWGTLNAGFATCNAGAEQSPVDLSTHISAAPLMPKLAWSRAHSAHVVNNGHTIQVNVHGAGGITHNNKMYQLVQFHFHHRSEHTINGRHSPMEVHFVHKAADGDLAVIGVMIEKGPHNPDLQPIWDAAPVTMGQVPLHVPVTAEAFLPKASANFQYAGSLTTPPCTEVVAWTVMRQPITASEEQIGAFAWLFPNNARPVQPLNRRMVLATN